jgi:hypothetical protein
LDHNRTKGLSFAKIKDWIFLTYPELATKTADRQERIDEILAESGKKSSVVGQNNEKLLKG